MNIIAEVVEHLNQHTATTGLQFIASTKLTEVITTPGTNVGVFLARETAARSESTNQYRQRLTTSIGIAFHCNHGFLDEYRQKTWRALLDHIPATGDSPAADNWHFTDGSTDYKRSDNLIWFDIYTTTRRRKSGDDMRTNNGS